MHVGIDLGTTFSLISTVDRGERLISSPTFMRERFSTPCLIHVGSEGALVGHAVEALLENAPSLPVTRFIKLRMGSEEAVFTDSQNRLWYPEGLSALILSKLRRDVAALADELIEGAILCVPRISPTRSGGPPGARESWRACRSLI